MGANRRAETEPGSQHMAAISQPEVNGFVEPVKEAAQEEEVD